MEKKFNINDVRESYPNIKDKSLLLIELICNKTIDSRNLELLESVYKYINQCYNRPSDIEIKMEALNQLIEGHGIEAITDENKYINGYWYYCIALYVNMGDSYLNTFIYDTENDQILFMSCADFMQSIENTE